MINLVLFSIFHLNWVRLGYTYVLQILRAIRLFKYQVTLFRSLVTLVLTMTKQDVVKSCTPCIVLYPIILGEYWHLSCVSVTQPTSAIHFFMNHCMWTNIYLLRDQACNVCQTHKDQTYCNICIKSKQKWRWDGSCLCVLHNQLTYNCWHKLSHMLSAP